MRTILLVALVLQSMTINVAKANDTIKVDRLNAIERTTEIEVTPEGLVIDFGIPIKSVNISHKSQIVFSGFDGILCPIESKCDEPPPTILFVRKIPPIDFKNEESMPENTSMLYVNTNDGIYRFQIKPISDRVPEYTEVEIDEPIEPLLP